MRTPMAWVNDGLVPLSEASVSVLDVGFRTGEGVFETMRIYGRSPFRLAEHLVRSTHGAERLGFEPPSDDLIRAAVEATIAANTETAAPADSAVRLTLTPGQLDPDSAWPLTTLGRPTLVATWHPLTIDQVIYDTGVRAIVVPWAREAPDVKAVSYLAAILARREAHGAGADEALLTDPEGNVLEGSASNLFAVENSTLITPPVTAGLLPGVTRAAVMQVAAATGLDVQEEPLPLGRLRSADEAFLTASTREVVPLVDVAGTRIADGRPGPVTGRLLEGYRALVRRETGS